LFRFGSGHREYQGCGGEKGGRQDRKENVKKRRARKYGEAQEEKDVKKCILRG